MKSVGPNATLLEGDIEAVIRGLKAQLVGEIQVAGPEIARFLTDLGLIDEYRLYFRPVVLGRGKPFFAGPQPPLRLVANDGGPYPMVVVRTKWKYKAKSRSAEFWLPTRALVAIGLSAILIPGCAGPSR